MKFDINAIILTAGFSKRMGCDKLILPFKGKTIIENTFNIIKRISFREIVAVYREEHIKDLAEEKGFLCVKNFQAEKGMSESIKLGIENSAHCDGYMFFVGDQVFLSEIVILKLIDTFKLNRNSIIVPLYAGMRGNPVIFPAEFKDELMNLTGDKGGRVIIDKYESKVKFVNIDDSKLGIDVDTKEEYLETLKE